MRIEMNIIWTFVEGGERVSYIEDARYASHSLIYPQTKIYLIDYICNKE